jgi:bifunctional non-homologous end joining protein LigD
MSLRDYQRKRDFSKTSEPQADVRKNQARRAIFVVQLHHASSRHFDFRLQVGDTLKSWAVPKGPSFDPSVKRLAVEVEDHPIAYADFEGDIAEGYGKGHVDQFDKGVWSTAGDAEAQLQKGHLEFELFGQRLKGRWHLVRSSRRERQPAWFLVKAKDAFAADVDADDLLNAAMKASTRKAAKTSTANSAAKKTAVRTKPVPKPKAASRSRLAKSAASLPRAMAARPSGEFFKPQLARLREHPPSGGDWIHEVKWDGYRLLATIVDGTVQLWSRNGLPWNEKLPEVVQAIEALGLSSAQFDGELIALDERGHSDFSALQKTLSGDAQKPLAYMMFDLPCFEGLDLTRVALTDRKALLKRVLAHAAHPLAFSSHSVGNGEAAMAMANEQSLEGIVSKRADSGYRAGRGDDWLKIKRMASDEFAVVGYTAPRGSRSGFGSLLLARPDPDTARGWIYAGRVGTGFTDAQLAELTRTLATGGAAKPPVPLKAIDPLLQGARWIKPSVVAEVFHRGIGNQDMLRQPSLKTLRFDKTPADLRRGDRAAAAAPAPRGKTKTTKSADGIEAIVITHPDRVVYADEAITKQDVADYYRKVMDWFLPGVLNRPTSVIRCPEGTAKACFFQKHLIQGLHHVGTATLKEDSGTKTAYLYPDSAASIIELVQFGALEFHPWGTTVTDADRADRIVFDLDPGPNVSWDRVVAAARLVRKLLAQTGLESLVRTTGGKGLHVVVPLKPSCAWDMVRAFAEAFANSLAGAHPLDFVATASKTRRGGKIYVDYLRNGRGATSVASYSLRARPHAPVATPLRWDELGKLKSGAAFTIETLPKRLARLRSDPWKDLATIEQDLPTVLKTWAASRKK